MFERVSDDMVRVDCLPLHCVMLYFILYKITITPFTYSISTELSYLFFWRMPSTIMDAAAIYGCEILARLQDVGVISSYGVIP